MGEKHLLEAVRALVGDDTANQLPIPGLDIGSPSDASDGFPALSEMDQPPSDALVDLGLTPEQYIRDALEAHGGRLKQQAVCELTGWSDGTVSQKLGAMESNGTIVRFRDGREKIACLPEHGPLSQSTHADQARATKNTQTRSLPEPTAHD